MTQKIEVIFFIIVVKIQRDNRSKHLVWNLTENAYSAMMMMTIMLMLMTMMMMMTMT